jgi:hypothetical protein
MSSCIFGNYEKVRLLWMTALAYWPDARPACLDASAGWMFLFYRFVSGRGCKERATEGLPATRSALHGTALCALCA